MTSEPTSEPDEVESLSSQDGTPDGVPSAGPGGESAEPLKSTESDSDEIGPDEIDAELIDLIEGEELEITDESPFEGASGDSDAAAERDEYRDALLRVKAEFDNYRKRSAKEQSDLTARANVRLATELLPVLDACDAALGHGATDVEPIFKSLLEILGKEGLERMDPAGSEFDPNLHEAVAHEDGDGSAPVVAETFRIGYSWRGQVIRAPMVKVRG